MKYVRTKYESFPIAYERDKPNSEEPLMFADGTIAFINDEDIVHLGHPRCSSFYARRKHIIKESDNIEDLFAEYVLENKDHTYQSLLVKAEPCDKRSFSESFIKDVKNGWYSYCHEYLKNGYAIYGAIIIRGEHDEPKLKPVAILNNKEEWELI